MAPPRMQDQTPDEDRRSRFAFDNNHPSSIGNIREFSLPAALRERAASQPPRRPAADALPTRLELAQRRYESPFGAPGTPPPSATASLQHWPPSRHASFAMNQPSSPTASSAIAGSFPSRTVPTRSLSFSTTSDLPSRFHSFMGDSFPSTFEDEEEEFEYTNDLEPEMSGGNYHHHGGGGHHAAQSMSFGGSRDAAYLRNARAAALAAAEGSSRSRSQSLAAMNRRQLPPGLGSSSSSNFSTTLPAPGSAGVAQSWKESFAYRTQILPGGPSELITLPSPVGTSFASGSQSAARLRGPDLSNMSPFVRDVGQILLDDGSNFRDLWVGAPGIGQLGDRREDGGGSGTTSRRHSVSVVQPRSRQASTAVMGFTALDPSIEDEDAEGERQGRRWGDSSTGPGGRMGIAHRMYGPVVGRSVITDDELAIDLNNLNLHLENQARSTQQPQMYHPGGPSQPSSLPNFGVVQQGTRLMPGDRGITPTTGLHLGQGSNDGGSGGQVSPSMQSAAGRGPVNTTRDRVSPNFDTTQQQHPGGARGPSVSPNRMNGRRASREREGGMAGIAEYGGPAGNLGQQQQRGGPLNVGGAGMQHFAPQPPQPQRGPPRGAGGPLSLMNMGGSGATRGPVSPSVTQPNPNPQLSPTLRQQRSFSGHGMSPVVGPPGDGQGLGYFWGGSGPNPGVGGGGGQRGGAVGPGVNMYGYVAIATAPLSPATGSGGFAGVAQRGGAGLTQIQTSFQNNSGPQAAGDPYYNGLPRSPIDRYNQYGGHGGGQTSNVVVPQHNVQLPAPPAATLSDLGRGVPLHSISSSTPLFVVEFKAGRSDLFFSADPNLAGELSVGDLVIVEADRGRDLGKVVKAGISGEEVELFQRAQAQRHSMMMGGGGGDDDGGGGGGGGSGISPVKQFAKEIMPKRLYSKATQHDVEMLAAKGQDEAKALQLCQNKVRAKKLPMEVVEAEYQWDRRKLTFYFVSDRRIDFRELVRELFRLYKTRIWMACLQGPAGGMEA